MPGGLPIFIGALSHVRALEIEFNYIVMIQSVMPSNETTIKILDTEVR